MGIHVWYILVPIAQHFFNAIKTLGRFQLSVVTWPKQTSYLINYLDN